MEARIARAALLAAALLSCGANWRSENFVIVSAPSDEVAKEIAAQAEQYRRELAVQWLGQELPRWREPCPIAAYVGPREPSRGKTTFIPTGGVPYGWQMEIYGTRERVLDSVLPHEVLHTVFATHFGVPLPRWADEGACTTVEHASERAKQEGNLIVYLKTERGIPFSTMFALKDYPRDMLPLYAQGYSVARYLIAHGGERKFVDFIGDGLRNRSWTKATQRHYGFESLAELQNQWLAWVKQGSPPISRHAEPTRQELADSDPTAIKAQLARVRGGDALESDNRSSPRPPSAFDARVPEEKTSVARPESGGWYKRQKQRTADDERRSETEIIRGQEPDSLAPPAPPPEQQGNADQQPGSASRPLVPLRRPLRSERSVASAPAGNRQVLLEWNRPQDQPWDGTAPAAEVALRSEPKSLTPALRQVEYFDAPPARDAAVWR